MSEQISYIGISKNHHLEIYSCNQPVVNFYCRSYIPYRWSRIFNIRAEHQITHKPSLGYVRQPRFNRGCRVAAGMLKTTALNVSYKKNRPARCTVSAIQAVDVTGLVQLLNEAHVHEIARVGIARCRQFFREFIQNCFEAFG